MSQRSGFKLSRRDLLKAGGLTAAALGAGAAAGGPRLLAGIGRTATALAVDRPPDLKLVGTDGWISLPPAPSIFSNSLGVVDPPGQLRAGWPDDVHLRLRQRLRA